MSEILGFCAERFGDLRTVFAEHLDRDDELGASIAVTVDGEFVVDMWGGWADAERTTPWGPDTITNVWSTTKTVLALAALMLVDRGELDVHAPVAKYWPQFAANGKADIEVRHLLSHTSGVSGWDKPVTLEVLYDWDESTARLAAQAPWWAPGTASGYHAITQGHLVGEVLRRITGSSPGRFVADEICAPLDADFHIGLDPAEFARVSDVIPPPPPAGLETLDPTSLSVRTFTGPVAPARAANTEAWRRAEVPAANGHGNARSVARIQSVLAVGGELDGVRLLHPKTIESIFEQQSDGVDLVLDVPLRFGLGFGIPTTAALPYIPDRRVCFWGGYGGSAVLVDLDHRAVFTYMMNRMGPGILGSDRGAAYSQAFFAAID